MDYPLWKNSTFWNFSTCCFYCLKIPFPPSTISWNVFFWPVLCRIERWKCFKFLTENMDYPLRKNPNFSFFLTFYFYSSKGFSSFLKCRETHIFLTFCPTNIKMAKFQIFDQNHGLNPLKKLLIFRLNLVLVFIG